MKKEAIDGQMGKTRTIQGCIVRAKQNSGNVRDAGTREQSERESGTEQSARRGTKNHQHDVPHTKIERRCILYRDRGQRGRE